MIMRSSYIKHITLIFIILFLGITIPLWAQQELTTQQSDDNKKTDDSTKAKSDDSKDEKEAVDTTKGEPPLADIDSLVSVWGTDKQKDSSKAEEYGDVPHGFLLESLRTSLITKTGRYFDITAHNTGLNNGQYGFNYGVFGNYNLYIDYNKIPHLFSKDGETIWNEAAPAQWRLADSVQQAIQNLNPVPTDDPTYQAGLAQQRAFISSLLTEAHPTPLGLQRNRGDVGFDYSINTNWKYDFEYFQENRDGFRPLGTTLGFSWAIELPEQIEYKTYRTRTGIEYTKNSTTFSANYEYLDFKNENQAMIWDNPYRITDRADQTAGDGTSQGQLQLPASNHGNLFTLAGGTLLGKGRISGLFSYNDYKDSVDLLPYTINSALEQVPLPSPTFNGEFRNINANVRYYVPVMTHGNLTINYRLFDESNKNDQFVFTAFSPYDNSISTDEPATNDLVAYKTNTIDADFNYALSHGLHALAGYTFNRWDRDDREVNQTNTNTFRLGLDALGTDKLTFHARYQYDHRTSDHFDLDNPTYDVIPLRRFDTANLNRNTFRVTADYMLSNTASIGPTFSIQNNDYPDSAFGLQHAKYYTVGADFSYAVNSKSSFDAWYEFAKNVSDQLGRQSSSSPSTTPDFDWSANLRDNYNTIGVGYMTTFCDSKVGWDTNFTYAKANGFEDLTGGVAIRATGAVDLPNADDTDHTEFRTQVSVKTFRHAQLVVGYWFDKYTISDFSEDAIQTDLIVVTVPGPSGPTTSTPGTILLNAKQGDYTYNSGWVGVVFNW
ncbi:MAG: hypothetical protein C5B54_08125 [Acidobacteria bacterium]|nr:MAG: hypothetical protein C5B54_08125 [Acidobacteriota bacterium]